MYIYEQGFELSFFFYYFFLIFFGYFFLMSTSTKVDSNIRLSEAQCCRLLIRILDRQIKYHIQNRRSQKYTNNYTDTMDRQSFFKSRGSMSSQQRREDLMHKEQNDNCSVMQTCLKLTPSGIITIFNKLFCCYSFV